MGTKFMSDAAVADRTIEGIEREKAWITACHDRLSKHIDVHYYAGARDDLRDILNSALQSLSVLRDQRVGIRATSSEIEYDNA